VLKINKTQIAVYRQLWEYCLQQGLKTVSIIEEEDAWDFRIFPREHSVRETFNHVVKAIQEDAGRWFMDEIIKYIPSGVPSNDLTRAINHMINAFDELDDEKLGNELTFQWEEKTTIAGVLQQCLFHAVGHFSQIRNWVGISKRNEGNT